MNEDEKLAKAIGEVYSTKREIERARTTARMSQLHMAINGLLRLMAHMKAAI